MTRHRNRPASRPIRAAVQGHTANQRLTWYLGLGLMAFLELIDWPVAVVLAVSHELGHRARTRALRELAGGIEAGA